MTRAVDYDKYVTYRKIDKNSKHSYFSLHKTYLMLAIATNRAT